jgi:hypothetical protein
VAESGQRKLDPFAAEVPPACEGNLLPDAFGAEHDDYAYVGAGAGALVGALTWMGFYTLSSARFLAGGQASEAAASSGPRTSAAVTRRPASRSAAGEAGRSWPSAS